MSVVRRCLLSAQPLGVGMTARVFANGAGDTKPGADAGGSSEPSTAVKQGSRPSGRTQQQQAELAEAGRRLANSVMCSRQFKKFYEDFRNRQKGAAAFHCRSTLLSITLSCSRPQECARQQSIPVRAITDASFLKLDRVLAHRTHSKVATEYKMVSKTISGCFSESAYASPLRDPAT